MSPLTPNQSFLYRAKPRNFNPNNHLRSHFIQLSITMDPYQKVVKPRAEQTIDENEIRITSHERMRSYITYALTLLQVARQLGVCVKHENLRLTSPLSSLGEFAVPLQLPNSLPLPEGKVQWTLDVKIRKK